MGNLFIAHLNVFYAMVLSKKACEGNLQMIAMPLYSPGKESPDEAQELIEGLESFEGGEYADPTKEKPALRSRSKMPDKARDSWEFATRMIRDGVILEKVSKLSGLGMADIRELAARISTNPTR